MNPNDIPRWLDEHGGAAGPPQTDANGVTTHRARDGSYVTVFNGQVRMIGAGSQAAPGAETTTAPVQAAGGGMDQAALEARIAELQKQYPGLKFMGRSMKEKNRSRVDEETGRTVTETVSVPIVEWRDPTTGYTLTAEVGPGGGTYTVTEDRLIEGNKTDTKPGAGVAEPPTTKDEGGRRWVWQPNPGGPNAGGRWVDVGSAPETPAERQAREANAPTQSVRVEEVNGVKYTVITIVPKPGQQGEPAQVVLGPDGKQLAGGIPGKQPVEDRKPVTGPDGKTYIRVTVQKPDGSVEVYHTDQNNVRTNLPDDPSKKPIPGNAPVFSPDQKEADLGLTAYARVVRQRTDLSKEQQDQLIREAHGTAQTVISRQTSTINTQEGTRSAEITQRGQDAQLAANRLSTASSVYGNAIRQASDDTKYSTGADAMAVAPYYMLLGQAASRMFGPTETPARVQNGPAIQQVQQQGLPTVSQVLATAPGNPVAPAVDPAAAAAAEAARRQQAAANPVFKPAPVAGAAPSPAPPVPPAQQPQSPGVPGMMMPNSPTIDPSPSPATEPLPPQAQGPNPAINPVTGEPTGLPPMSEFGQPGDPNLFAQPPAPPPVLIAPMTTEPQQQQQPSGGAFPPLPVIPRAGTEAGGNVQMAPVPQNPVAMALGAGPWQQQPQGQQPGGMVGTQLMAADGAYDPASVNDEWLAAGADPAIVAMFGGGRRAVA